jgi:hypothetical protein
LGIEKVVSKKTFDFRAFKGTELLVTLVSALIFQSQGFESEPCDLILTFNIQNFFGKIRHKASGKRRTPEKDNEKEAKRIREEQCEEA